MKEERGWGRTRSTDEKTTETLRHGELIFSTSQCLHGSKSYFPFMQIIVGLEARPTSLPLSRLRSMHRDWWQSLNRKARRDFLRPVQNLKRLQEVLRFYLQDKRTY